MDIMDSCINNSILGYLFVYKKPNIIHNYYFNFLIFLYNLTGKVFLSNSGTSVVAIFLTISY